MNKEYQNPILDIHCASCGSPANFDIANQIYRCGFCGSQTGISESLQPKKHFRELHREGMRNAKPQFKMFSASCSGCGAEIVFPEGEPLTVCSFCGRKLVRKESLGTDDFPELLIPFKITKDEAKRRLLEWCDKNKRRKEAKRLRKSADQIEGYYLPYMLVKGPDSCSIIRDSAERKYECRGYIDAMFVNTSKNISNMVLNGTEPYDLSELREFDFSYLAGQRVKIADITGEEADSRIKYEISSEYETFVSGTMQTKAVFVTPDTSALMEMSVVLPAYYIRAGTVTAAVNGQTGKVAVSELKDRFLLPWWLKPIAATLILTAVIFGAAYLISKEIMASAFVTGLMFIFLATVLFTAYHNEYAGDPRWKLRKRILTSENSRQEIADPVFFEMLDGEAKPVRLKLSTPFRSLKQAAITVGAVFLPYITAFILNGFSAKGLTLSGAAVWMCITVPIAPVYLIKLGRIDMYNHPLIYVENKKGKYRRYRKKITLKSVLSTLKSWADPVTIGIAAFVILVFVINVALVL